MSGTNRQAQCIDRRPRVPIAWHHGFNPSEEVLNAMPAEVLWPILTSPTTVALWIPGAVLTKSGEGVIDRGTMR